MSKFSHPYSILLFLAEVTLIKSQLKTVSVEEHELLFTNGGSNHHWNLKQFSSHRQMIDFSKC